MKKSNSRAPRGDRKSGGPRKPAPGRRSDTAGRGPKRSFGERGPRTEEGRDGSTPTFRPRGPVAPDRGPKKSFSDRGPKREDERRAPRDGEGGRSSGRSERSARPGARDEGRGRGPSRPAGPYKGKGPNKPRPEKPWKRQSQDERTFKEGGPLTRRPFRRGERSNRFSLPNPAHEGLIRLNRFLAHAGIGSRREADTFITSGAVTVNGVVVTALGTMIKSDDTVHFGSQKLSIEQKRYVLMNKPKDTITTTDDPSERHTVMDLIGKACTERLYPVGRLDRHTTGVLLLTNDGDLAKKLTHPSHGAEKLYHVTLDKSISVEELHRLSSGIQLDDGMAKADEVSYAGETKREVGIKLHMGRNRIVRRMFEALGYEVLKLDRVMFAGLTKKDLQRGHWRHLSEKEVTWLKQMKEAPKSSKEERSGRRTRLSQGSE